jgi:hypothetical protein
MMELLERFVVAFESMAKSASIFVAKLDSVECPLPASRPETLEEKIQNDADSEPGEEQSDTIEADYDAMDYEELKKICLEKSMVIPKGTKRPTLIKWLKGEAEPEYAKAMESDPTPSATTTEVPPKSDPPAAEKVSLEDVKSKVMVLITAGQRSTVAGIFEKYGAANLTALTEDKYASVIADCDDEIAKLEREAA